MGLLKVTMSKQIKDKIRDSFIKEVDSVVCHIFDWRLHFKIASNIDLSAFRGVGPSLPRVPNLTRQIKTKLEKEFAND
jgi:hypothetical protein